MKSPAFQLYAADFYMDTVGWTCEEVGLYFRLLMAEWVNGYLPNDEVRLAKVCQMSVKKFHHNFKNVSPKFVQNGKGYLINERLEETRKKQEEYHLKLIESGRKGGIKSQETQHHIRSEASSEASSEGPSESKAFQSSSSSSSSKEKKRYVTDMTGLIKLYGKEKATSYLQKVDTFAKTHDVSNKFALADSWIQKDIKPTPRQDDDDPFARIPKCDTCKSGYMKNKPTCWACLGLERKRKKQNDR